MWIWLTSDNMLIPEMLAVRWQSIFEYGDIYTDIWLSTLPNILTVDYNRWDSQLNAKMQIYVAVGLPYWVLFWLLFKRPNQVLCSRDYNAIFNANYNYKLQCQLQCRLQYRVQCHICFKVTLLKILMNTIPAQSQGSPATQQRCQWMTANRLPN